MLPSKTFQGRYVKPGSRRFFSREIFVGFSLAFSRFPRKGQLLPRKIAPLPPYPTPKLTLTQTLTLTRVQFFSGAIVWLVSPPTLKLTLTLTKTPTVTGRQFCLGGNCPDTFENTPAACYSWQSFKEEDIFLCSCEIMIFLFNDVFYLMTYII